MRPSRGALSTGACVAVYLLLAVVAFWHVWSGHPTSDMQLGADQFRNVWFLAWVPYAIGHGLNPLFSGWANVSTGVNLLTDAGVPVLGFVFAPVTLLWGPVATLNVVSTLALAGSATSGYALIRRLTTWKPAAFFGGLLYGFSPAIVAQADGHINLSFEVVPPLILLLLHDLLVTHRGRPVPRGILLGVLVTVQYFISSEILFDTAFVTAVAIVTALVVGRHGLRPHVRQAARGLVAGAVTAVVLLAWPIWFLIKGPAHVSGKLQLVPEAYRSDLAGVVVPDSNQYFNVHRLLVHADQYANSPGENGAYLGIILVVVLLIAVVVLRRNAAVIVASVAGAAGFVLSLGGALAVRKAPQLTLSGGAAGRIPLPERVFSDLPVLDNIIPTRYGILVDLFVAVVLAVFVDHLHQRRSGEHRPGDRHGAHHRTVRTGGAVLLPSAVAVIALLPLVPKLPFVNIGPTGTPAAYTTAARDLPAGRSVLLFPFGSNTFPQPDLWQAQAHFRFKMAGGYFLSPQGPDNHLAFSTLLGYAPISLTADVLTRLAEGQPQAEQPSLRRSILAQLHGWGVNAVLATPGASTNPALSLAYLTWLFGPPRRDISGTDVWASLRT